MTAIALTPGTKEVATSLKDLAAQINEAVTKANQAAKSASQPYYITAGNLLLEAKHLMKHGEFTVWVRNNFKFGMRNAQLYMSVATATLSLEKRNAYSASDDLSFREAIREHTGNKNFAKRASWHSETVTDIRKAREQAKHLENEHLTRQQERDADRKLALQLISIGFKALASKLHPDKGGTRDAMARLNRVRDRLKAHA